MDKYEGIKKSESVSYEIVYKVNDLKKERKRESRGMAFTVIRYLICFALIAFCLAGKFLNYEPIKQASGLIKSEIERDILVDLSIPFINEK